MSVHRPHVHIFRTVFLLILSMVFLSCGAGKGIVEDVHLQRNLQVWYAPDFQKIQIKQVAILPFVTPEVRQEDKGSDVICSFCGHPMHEHKDFSIEGGLLAEYLYEDLKKSASYEIVPLEQAFSIFNLQRGGRDLYSDIQLIMELGKKLGVDAVVVGEVLRIRERVGGNYSVISPASVAFRLKMIRVQDGMEFCKVLYDETQKPWSEEPQRLFHWSKIRFRWLTADQLARAGIHEVVMIFPGVPVR